MQKDINQQIEKTPILIGIFSIILFIEAIWGIVQGVFFITIASAFAYKSVFSLDSLVVLSSILVIPIAKIIAAIGMRKVKRWAIYVILGIIAIEISTIPPISLLHTYVPMGAGFLGLFIDAIVNTIILAYILISKKFNIIKTITIIAVTGLIVGGAYFYFNSQSSKMITGEISTNTTGEHVYSNNKYGFEFAYPKDWDLKVNDFYYHSEICGSSRYNCLS